MAKKKIVRCETHGKCQTTFVCAHLLGNSAGQGFNREDPAEDNPFPDAWCDNCELIRASHGGWNKKSEKLLKISILCSGCYERARIRNTRTSGTLEDLAGLKWKCGHCEEWHVGPCLDFGYDAPHYWRKKDAEASQRESRTPNCAIEDRDFFVRGVIHLPIFGSNETLCWGVWGSLSRENFERLLAIDREKKRAKLPAMFSWLSNRIPDYPDTLNLKMHAHIQEPGQRPHFELEPIDHPLSREYHEGITLARVKEIMMRQLPGNV